VDFSMRLNNHCRKVSLRRLGMAINREETKAIGEER
jgi:hypothetical protein